MCQHCDAEEVIIIDSHEDQHVPHDRSMHFTNPNRQVKKKCQVPRGGVERRGGVQKPPSKKHSRTGNVIENKTQATKLDVSQIITFLRQYAQWVI